MIKLDWDSNFSMINFLNDSLRSSNNSVLLFADKFLIQKNTLSYSYLREMGSILQNPFILKTLIRYLQKNKELIYVRTTCMEIIFNLLVSNNDVFLESLDSPLCNFYDALSNLIFYQSISQFEESQFKDLRELLKKTVYILLEMQNPLIKTHIFNNNVLTKYIREHNYYVYPRYDLDYISKELNEIKEFLNFNGYIDLINRLINAFKCWIQNYYLKDTYYQNITNHFKEDKNKYSNKNENNKSINNNKFKDEIAKKEKEYQYDDTILKLQEIICIFIQIFNIEWKEGLKYKSQPKNCLIYNLIKLIEWLSMKNLHYLIFDNTEEISFSNLIIFWSKIQDFYQNLIIDDYLEKNEKENEKEKLKERFDFNNFENSKQLARQHSLKKIDNKNVNHNRVSQKYDNLDKINNNFSYNSINLSNKEIENLNKKSLKKFNNINPNYKDININNFENDTGYEVLKKSKFINQSINLKEKNSSNSKDKYLSRDKKNSSTFFSQSTKFYKNESPNAKEKNKFNIKKKTSEPQFITLIKNNSPDSNEKNIINSKDKDLNFINQSINLLEHNSPDFIEKNNLIVNTLNNLNNQDHNNLNINQKNSSVILTKSYVGNGDKKKKNTHYKDDENYEYLSSNIFNKIYHLISIKLLNIISQIFISGNEKYIRILERSKIGVQLGVLFRSQYRILADIFETKVNDINILNNFIQENNIRLSLFENIFKTRSEEIRLQFLDSNFIEFLVTDISNCYSKFSTIYKKISLEFLVFKESFPIRMEALSFIYYIMKNKDDIKNKIIYDEFIKNMKKHMFVHRELINIKNVIKGPKIHSIMTFFSIILALENKDLTYTMVKAIKIN